MNQYSVFVGGTEYTCTQFFDTDKGEGLDIRETYSRKYIGEMLGETIPDLDEMDSEEIETFETNVIEFIEENL